MSYTRGIFKEAVFLRSTPTDTHTGSGRAVYSVYHLTEEQWTCINRLLSGRLSSAQADFGTQASVARKERGDKVISGEYLYTTSKPKNTTPSGLRLGAEVRHVGSILVAGFLIAKKKKNSPPLFPSFHGMDRIEQRV